MTYSRNALTCRDCGACLTDCSPLRNGLMAAAGQTPSGGNRRATECLLLVRNERRRRLAERIASFYRRLWRIVSNPVTRTIVSILLGGPSSAFLRHPDYRARFLSLIRGIDRTPEEDAVLVVGYPVHRRVRPVVRWALPMTRAA